jgi:hypothetical protein
MKMGQSFPKGQRLKFRRRGITQKKEYNIPNMSKVLNQEFIVSVCFNSLNGNITNEAISKFYAGLRGA